jgi:arylsulfatase A-like enzyme
MIMQMDLQIRPRRDQLGAQHDRDLHQRQRRGALFRHLAVHRPEDGALQGGLRVPAVTRWPSWILCGIVSEQVTIGMDWFPTPLIAAGTAPNAAYPSDGIDLLPVLVRRAAPSPRKLFWRYKYNDQQAARRRLEIPQDPPQHLSVRCC